MRTLAGTELLAVWERAARLHPLDRGLALLGAALPDVPYATLADWPLGRRNRTLTECLCTSFGPRLAGQATCVECGEELEFEFDARVLLESESANPDARVEVGGHIFRPPSTRDLARLVDEEDAGRAVTALLEGCRIDEGDALSLSEADLDELGERLALADPLAETRIMLSCTECGAEFEETLDVTAFAWAEVESRARRLLLEVHRLARAYGWTETEVLSLGEERRAFYLMAAGQ